MLAIAPVESLPFATQGSARTTALEAPTSAATGATPGATPLDSFGSFLGNAVDEANRADFAASQKVDALASGAADDLHGTMISVKEAEIAIKLVGTVRNKVLDAFQELWRTSV